MVSGWLGLDGRMKPSVLRHTQEVEEPCQRQQQQQKVPQQKSAEKRGVIRQGSMVVPACFSLGSGLNFQWRKLLFGTVKFLIQVIHY